MARPLLSAKQQQRVETIEDEIEPEDLLDSDAENVGDTQAESDDDDSGASDQDSSSSAESEESDNESASSETAGAAPAPSPSKVPSLVDSDEEILTAAKRPRTGGKPAGKAEAVPAARTRPAPAANRKAAPSVCRVIVALPNSVHLPRADALYNRRVRLRSTFHC